MYKHWQDRHRDKTEVPEYKMKLLTSHRDNLSRCIREGLEIEKQFKEDPGSVMNSKTEWGRTKIVRVTATTQMY